MARCSPQDPEALQPVGGSGCCTVLAASLVALKTSCSAVSSCMALAFSSRICYYFLSSCAVRFPLCSLRQGTEVLLPPSAGGNVILLVCLRLSGSSVPILQVLKCDPTVFPSRAGEFLSLCISPWLPIPPAASLGEGKGLLAWCSGPALMLCH